ncbi:MAG: hypothetical protein AAFP26_08600 [Planctomycetota bacterium]
MARVVVLVGMLLQSLLGMASLPIAPVGTGDRDTSLCCPLCPSLETCGCGCAASPEQTPSQPTPRAPAPSGERLVAGVAPERGARLIERTVVVRPRAPGSPGAFERAGPSSAVDALAFLCVWTT